MSSVPCDLSANNVSTSPVPADALFASALQRSDRPSPGQVRQAIAVAVARYGGSGCAARDSQPVRPGGVRHGAREALAPGLVTKVSDPGLG